MRGRNRARLFRVRFDCGEIPPPEFTERRFILGISARSFQRPGQRAKEVIREFEYSLGHVAVGPPIAFIIERVSTTAAFERKPELIETEWA